MSLRAAIVAIACLLTAVSAIPSTKLHPLSDEFIDFINSKQTSWKAGRNFPPNTPVRQLNRLLGVDPDFSVDKLPKVEHPDVTEDNLPESFDPREKWPNCTSLREIRDQGSCSGSWAFGAVEVMTDRVCIYSNGTRQFHFSAEDVLSCCTNTKGCHGGKPERAWNYWKWVGIVSGGNYNSSQGCKPYSFPTCDHRIGAYTNGKMGRCANYSVETPHCVRKCESSYNGRYKKDKQYGKSVYTVDVEIYIKAELMQNGPVQAVFWLFADFFNYKSGVYYYTGGNFVGLHAVKLMGWGVENGTKYWLAANSWNSGWGDNGFFKILRGEDHLRIASNLIAGEPRL